MDESIKRYFVWAMPASGKSTMAKKYRNVIDFDVAFGVGDIPYYINQHEIKLEYRNVLCAPFIATDFNEPALIKASKWFENFEKKTGMNVEPNIVLPELRAIPDFRDRLMRRDGEGYWADRAYKVIQNIKEQEPKLSQYGFKTIGMKPGQFLEDTLKENGISLDERSK